MRFLLFGKSGQLGWELQRSLAPLGEVIALGTHDVQGADFKEPKQLASAVHTLKPDVIVNAAAYTSVDAAESDAQAAMLVNGVAPGILADAAARMNAWLIHYSTDYVFDGAGDRPWREADPVAPLNVYGHTKLAGEQNIRTSGCKHLIFRTSWVYAARGNNFAKTMIRLAQDRDSLKVINDQFGAPTGADLLADVTAHAIRSALDRTELAGTYHVAPTGETSWFHYARHIISRARAAGAPIKVADPEIHPVPSSEIPTAAKRPANSRLDTRKLRTAFGLYLPHWQLGVDRMLTEILQ